MHALPPTQPTLNCRDVWTPTEAELETAATAVLGAGPGGWLRRGGPEMLISKRYWGAKAGAIPGALAELAALTQRIRADGRPAAGLRAATFYHLRFENIHPLRDGNGRVGRLLLAAQCAQATGLSAPEILCSIHDFENEYKWVFVPDEQAQRYELLLDLLARLTATPLAADAADFERAAGAGTPAARASARAHALRQRPAQTGVIAAVGFFF